MHRSRAIAFLFLLLAAALFSLLAALVIYQRHRTEATLRLNALKQLGAMLAIYASPNEYGREPPDLDAFRSFLRDSGAENLLADSIEYKPFARSADPDLSGVIFAEMHPPGETAYYLFQNGHVYQRNNAESPAIASRTPKTAFALLLLAAVLVPAAFLLFPGGWIRRILLAAALLAFLAGPMIRGRQQADATKRVNALKELGIAFPGVPMESETAPLDPTEIRARLREIADKHLVPAGMKYRIHDFLSGNKPNAIIIEEIRPVGEPACCLYRDGHVSLRVDAKILADAKIPERAFRLFLAAGVFVGVAALLACLLFLYRASTVARLFDRESAHKSKTSAGPTPRR